MSLVLEKVTLPWMSRTSMGAGSSSMMRFQPNGMVTCQRHMVGEHRDVNGWKPAEGMIWRKQKQKQGQRRGMCFMAPSHGCNRHSCERLLITHPCCLKKPPQAQTNKAWATYILSLLHWACQLESTDKQHKKGTRHSHSLLQWACQLESTGKQHRKGVRHSNSFLQWACHLESTDKQQQTGVGHSHSLPQRACHLESGSHHSMSLAQTTAGCLPFRRLLPQAHWYTHQGGRSWGLLAVRCKRTPVATHSSHRYHTSTFIRLTGAAIRGAEAGACPQCTANAHLIYHTSTFIRLTGAATKGAEAGACSVLYKHMSTTRHLCRETEFSTHETLARVCSRRGNPFVA
eukprot:1160945-Pelagomonas_calceolata.AAC.5